MKFVLEFNCDNVAFDGYATAEETARLLREAADKVTAGRTEGKLVDSNGNTVGEWRFVVIDV